jgi:hypothetical protein
MSLIIIILLLLLLLHYGLDGPGFEFRESVRNFSFETYRLILGPTQPPIQWVPGSCLKVKRPGRGANRSAPPPPATSEVKTDWSYTSTPPVWLRSVYREHFAFLS